MTTEVFDAAVSVARKVGYRNVTRRLIAEQLAKKGDFKGRPEQAMNFLINDGKMADLVKQLIDAKDRLALVPGNRVKSAQASYWREFDRSDLLDAAYRMAVNDGLFSLSMTEVAKASGFSRGTVNNYFTNLDGLRNEVVSMGVAHQNHKLCAQAVASGLPCAERVPDEFRQAALKSLA
ncbi:Bacterial regulatory protein, tetR family [compost metagenome]